MTITTLLSGAVEEASLCVGAWPAIRHDLGRLAALIRREGPITAFRKGIRYLSWRIPAEFRRARMLRLPQPESRFTMIYRTNMWAARESVSGPAASMANTAALRRELPKLFADMRIRSLFDAPCGDFYWMRHVIAESDVDYIGGDIVRPMIDANNATFADARCRFLHIDVTRDDVPSADLWLCRGLLSLLSNADGLAVLRQFLKSGTPHILLSTHCDRPRPINVDAPTGDFRCIDMMGAPFNLPPPLRRLEDRDGDEDLCLWSREQIERALAAGRHDDVDALVPERAASPTPGGVRSNDAGHVGPAKGSN